MYRLYKDVTTRNGFDKVNFYLVPKEYKNSRVTKIIDNVAYSLTIFESTEYIIGTQFKKHNYTVIKNRQQILNFINLLMADYHFMKYNAYRELVFTILTSILMQDEYE